MRIQFQENNPLMPPEPTHPTLERPNPRQPTPVQTKPPMNPDALYTTNDSWNFRPPSPPRIYIPPPGLDYQGRVSNSIIADAKVSKFNEFVSEEFLSKITHDAIDVRIRAADWDYAERHKAQRIVPFLYLGPFSIARDKTFIQKEGITLLLAIRDTKSAMAKLLNPAKTALAVGIASATVDVANHQELIRSFGATIKAINNHLVEVHNHRVAHGIEDKLGKVLIFCETGNERSAGMVAAYLMAVYNFNLATAVQVIQGQRFCVTFDDSMKHMLDTFHGILKAKQQVGQLASQSQNMKPIDVTGSPGQTTGEGRKPKRVLDDTEDTEDTEMGGLKSDNDGERFQNREAWAPFGDNVQQ